MADRKNWLQLLAYVTGSINQELLLRNEYLAAENHILKSQIKGRLRLSDGERATLAGIAKRLGRKALQEIACIAKPDTILAWYRKLVAQKFDGSKKRGLAGRPRVDAAIEELVVKLARENSGWGYDRIVGALANLGQEISDQSVGNILRRHGIAPAPKRKQSTTWSDFIRSHIGCSGRRGLLYGGSAHVEGPGDVLCAVLDPPARPGHVDTLNERKESHDHQKNRDGTIQLDIFQAVPSGPGGAQSCGWPSRSGEVW